MMMNDMRRAIFVTVGTTLFEPLIEAAVSESALNCMATQGFTHLIIQYGKGRPPQIPDIAPLEVVCYAFKPSLHDDMLDADLIVSHAGAGTIMEALALQKVQLKLAVVINSRLMDNHQTELAQAMGDRGHLFVIDEPDLLKEKETWDGLASFVPIRKEPGDARDFARVLDSFFGFGKVE